jgi:hypothetical protein
VKLLLRFVLEFLGCLLSTHAKNVTNSDNDLLSSQTTEEEAEVEAEEVVAAAVEAEEEAAE